MPSEINIEEFIGAIEKRLSSDHPFVNDQDTRQLISTIQEQGKDAIKLKEELRQADKQNVEKSEKIDELYGDRNMAQSNADDAKAENEELMEVVKLTAREKVNGYDVIKMLEDLKELSVKHGGYQNAYSISHVVECIKKARKVLNAK